MKERDRCSALKIATQVYLGGEIGSVAGPAQGDLLKDHLGSADMSCLYGSVPGLVPLNPRGGLCPF